MGFFVKKKPYIIVIRRKESVDMTVFQDINVLVCDDDKEIAGAIEIYLRNEAYKVFKAFNGLDALEITKKEKEQMRVHLLLCRGIGLCNFTKYMHRGYLLPRRTPH